MLLCLTVVVIAVTIIRVSGTLLDDTIDTVWGTYWLILSAEVGIIMTAMISFRAFLVSPQQRPGRKVGWGTNELVLPQFAESMETFFEKPKIMLMIMSSVNQEKPHAR